VNFLMAGHGSRSAELHDGFADSLKVRIEEGLEVAAGWGLTNVPDLSHAGSFASFKLLIGNHVFWVIDSMMRH